MELSVVNIEVLLRDTLQRDVQSITPLAGGEWSHAFRFSTADADGDFVLRLSDHVEDFHKDRLAAGFTGENLTVPSIVEIGSFDSGHYAISRYAPGVILDAVEPREWDQVIGSLSRSMRAIWAVEPPGEGWGGWDGRGIAAHASWREHLLGVALDDPTSRLFGWSVKLRSRPEAFAAFATHLGLLGEVATDDVPRSVIHADLLGNVLVDDGAVTAVFDWGCGVYGDPLYDLAWFEFWAPWYPQLNVTQLRDELELDLQAPGADQRMLACLLHIGLDHFAYNAALERWESLDRVMARTAELVRAYGR